MSDIIIEKTTFAFLGENEKNFENISFLGGNKINKYYKAFNIIKKRISCLKVIDKKNLENGDYDSLLIQVKREEEILKLCKCDNIVNIYDKYENDNFIIFELEFCSYNFAEYIKNHYPLKKNLNLFYDLIFDITKALKKLNEKGVMHRNIKPSNIFIKEKTFKLGGFGCAIYIKDNNFEPIGSLYYTAPEIIKNLEYDEKCDLWSFGITLYEILFGYLPYGRSINPSLLKEIILYEDNFYYEKTAIKELDVLFDKLLTINRKNRINHKKYINLILALDIDKLYDKLYIRKKEGLTDQMIRPTYFEITLKEDNMLLNDYKTKDFVINKIMNIIEGENLPDIMDFPGFLKFNNIIYYDENKNFINSIYKDSDIFEEKTPGSFILCTNLEELELIKFDIIKQFKKDKRIYFNLITTGSKCEKVLKFINKDKDFDDCIQNVCIYCKDVEKYEYLKNKFKKIHNDIYKKRTEVIDFIEKYSSSHIKPFLQAKLITYRKYIETYKYRHFEISKFYGNLNPDMFEKSYNKILSLIDEDSKNKQLKKDKEILNDGLSSFRINEDEYKDIIELDKLIIKEYTKNTFYGDLNKWLLSSKNKYFEPVAYFTARLMYSLNSFAIKQNKFFNENNKIVYRGIKMPYSSLLSYERAIGKIILFSSFTSTSEKIKIAEKFSSRKDSKELYKTNLKFSVIFYINNILRKNMISNGINIQGESKYNKEMEILYQPFSFYYVNNVVINLKNYTADIYLETIEKTCILEEEIQKGKEIIYNEKENILEINNNLVNK